MIKKYNISVPTEYTQKGQTKTRWDKIGVVIIMADEEGNEKLFVEIPAIKLKAQAFPFKEVDNLNKNYEKTNTTSNYNRPPVSDLEGNL